MSAADVTVVLPTRDRRRFLARSLASALAQTDVAFEVVVVDDGSCDGTFEWLESRGDERIRVVRHPEPRGVATARNTGVAAARTPWLAFLDDDDVWAPGKLAQQLARARASPESRWVCSGEVTLNSTLRIVGMASPPAPERALVALLAENVVPGGGSGVLAATDLVREVGAFDSSLGLLADWDLWIRLATEVPPAVVDRPLVGYVRHSGNMSWNVAPLVNEFATVDRKHAALRTQLGVWPNANRWSSWVTDAHRQAGRRRAAIGADLREAFHGRTARPVVRLLITAISPRAWVGLRDWRAARCISPVRREEAEGWLAPIRELDGSLTVGDPAVR
jgi:glycosyltransferase involved in cell wall biosynthesis